MALNGKVQSVATDSQGNRVNEVLGYTSADVMNDATANTTLKTFMQSLTSLTLNTYVKSIVDYEIELDTNVPPTVPSLIIGDATGSGTSRTFSYTYNGNGSVYLFVSATGDFNYVLNRSSKTITINGGMIGVQYTIELFATSTSNYASASTSKAYTWLS